MPAQVGPIAWRASSPTALEGPAPQPAVPARIVADVLDGPAPQPAVPARIVADCARGSCPQPAVRALIVAGVLDGPAPQPAVPALIVAGVLDGPAPQPAVRARIVADVLDGPAPQPAVPARIVAGLGFPAMTSMWGAPIHRRWRGSNLRDPRQAKFLTLSSLKWVLRNRAYTPWYLVRYFRLLKFKLANPHIITRGMVFIGKGVEIHATPELAQLEIGRWVHIGDKNTIRAHEGSLRFGDKVVLGRDNVINCYLDIELGDSVLMADWCYVCDFDHRMDDITLPIKDQGIVKSPIRIGPDTWVGVKVTVLRGTAIGRGCVLGSHAVVRGEVPDFSIAVGAPAKVVKNRQLAWETSAAQRAELAAALADIERKKAAR